MASPSSFWQNYHFYLLSRVTWDINNTTIFVSREGRLRWFIALNFQDNLVRSWTHSQLAIIVTVFTIRGRRRISPRAWETRVHSSAFADRISRSEFRSERGSTMITIHGPAGVPLMRVPSCGDCYYSCS